MTNEQQMVAEFHAAFGLQANEYCTLVDEGTSNLRSGLIQEELDEYRQALAEHDLVAVADALGDLLYVVYGAAVTHGIDLEPVFAEIHRSNMTKVGGHKSEAGKWIKPPTYSPADLMPILRDQSYAATCP